MLGGRSRPETSWIAEVTGHSAEETELAVSDLGAHAEAVGELAAAIERTGRSYYAQFPAPIDLFALVRLARPRKIVESGVASGVSSAFILMGLKANSAGKLHSIDLPVGRQKDHGNESWAIPAGLSSGWAVPSSLRRGWDLRKGKSEDLLAPLLEELGEVDLYCHDSPVDAKHFEFEMNTLRSHLKPGSLVVADNTYRSVFDETAKSAGAKACYRRKSSLGAFVVPGS